MAEFNVTLPGGTLWIPKFANSIDERKCIGCGRCFRVCGREVLQLVGLNEDGERIAVDAGEEDSDEEYEKKIMTIAHPENCIGCEACSRICPKKCYTNSPAPV